MYRHDEVERALTSIPDPMALLKGLFANSPVGFQIYRADGHSLLTNRAFRELFGPEPPPDLQQRLTPLIRRAFQGETITTPAAWYDARDLKHLRAAKGRRVAVSATISPILDTAQRVAYVAITFKDDTAEMAARDRAEAARRRVEFLASASSALSESLDLTITLTKVAHLAVPAIADWCTVTLADQDGQLHRIAVVHRDPGKLRFAQEYAKKFPPSQHRAGEFATVFATGMPVLRQHIDRELIRRAAQGQDHLRVLEELGVASCILVPLIAPSKKPIGVLSFMLSDESRTYGDEDLALARDLAAGVVLAIENARLYQVEQTARVLAQKQRDELALVASDSHAAEEQLRALIENLPEVAFSARADGHIEYLNRPWYEYTGFTLEQMQAWGWQLVHDPEMLPKVLDRWREALVSGEPFEMEFPLRGADGQYRWFLTRVRPLRNSRGQVVRWIGINTNIDQQRRQAALLEEAVQSRDTFLSVASHELKTPLTPMTLRLQALVRAADTQPRSPFVEQVRAYAQIASRQIRRLTGLVDQLLDVSRIAAGKLSLEVEDVDVAALVRDVVAHFEAQAARAESGLSLELPGSLALRVDKLRLEQVISNLVDNAIKYGSGKPIHLRLRKEQGQLVFSVEDQGIGIASDQRERIFERFERAVSDRNYGGLGLGLYIAKTMVEAMGGKIRVASELGMGATFTVELPAA